MAGAKLGESALRQIAEVVEHFAKRIINREINRVRPPSGMARYIGKTTEEVTQGTLTMVEIWSRGAGDGESSNKGTEADTEEEIECYARMGDIADGAWVFIEWIDGGWEVYCVECESS